MLCPVRSGCLSVLGRQCSNLAFVPKHQDARNGILDNDIMRFLDTLLFKFHRFHAKVKQKLLEVP